MTAVTARTRVVRGLAARGDAQHEQSAAGLRAALMMITALLAGLGVLMVYSASASADSKNLEQWFLKRHVVALGIGVVAAMAAAAVPARRWQQLASPLCVITLGLLVLVFVPGAGARVRGAQRWLRWGAVSFQPAELAKVTLVLCLAHLLTRGWRASARPLVKLVVGMVPVLATAGMVAAQPDFGTAVFLVLLGTVVLYFAGVRLRHLALMAIAVAPVGGFLLLQKPYRLERITGYLDSLTDFARAPYHIRQSLIALGSGGLTGTGAGKGWQKLSYLPEANNDFVFAVIGEELGLIGTLTVVALWAAMAIIGERLVRTVRHDRFACVAAAGLLVSLVLQAIINIAVVTALIPPKGIPLPLISYGGSSLLASLLSIGIVLSLTRAGESSNRARAIGGDA